MPIEPSTGNNNVSTKKKINFTTILLLLLFILIIYLTMGLFVIQPIGAIPEGTTILYWRYDTKLPFISSADGLLLKAKGNQGFSLFERGMMLGAIGKIMEDRKIANLPYIKVLYLISTGGQEFE